jgi:HPt (histidine-containing phosphotransfer) domain-containing protein
MKLNAEPVIDALTFAELKTTVGADFIGELIDAYLDDTPRLLNELEESLAGQDATKFTRTAHSIKSSSASLGALSFSAQAKELEMIGKQGSFAGVQPKVQQLKMNYVQVRQKLRELKDES